MAFREIEIKEIIRPADRGRSEPILCRGSDNMLYYLKGRQSGPHSKWSELICATLGHEIGLPIPPFCIAHVPEELIAIAPDDVRTLGAGPAFASQAVGGCNDFLQSMQAAIDIDKQCLILAFDWWVKNGDRIAGNTNLLWQPLEKKLVVIDHNCAFDAEVNSPDFFMDHVFWSTWLNHGHDLVLRDNFQQQFSQALADAFDKCCDNAPDDWRWNNPEHDVPANVDLATLKQTLLRCEQDDFWRCA